MVLDMVLRVVFAVLAAFFTGLLTKVRAQPGSGSGLAHEWVVRVTGNDRRCCTVHDSTPRLIQTPGTRNSRYAPGH